jgi:alpha-1,3-rhamnosyl/mannosyltransferase
VAEEDLPALYSGASLFVFPSLYEGFGLPVVEAMSCGCPVACSDSSSLPEIAGDAALLFDPRSIESMVESIRIMLQDEMLRRQLAERSKRRAAHFSWQRTADETLAIYRALAESTGSS